MNIFETILTVADDASAKRESDYSLRRAEWREDLKQMASKPIPKKNPGGPRRFFDYDPHLDWLRENIDLLGNDELAEGLSEQMGMVIGRPTLEVALRRLGIKRSPEAARRMMKAGSARGKEWKKQK